VVKAVTALAVVALLAAPIIYAAYSADVLNISLHITGINGGVLLSIEAAYRSSVPGSLVYGYTSMDVTTMYAGSRYRGNIVLSGEIHQGVAGARCEETSFSYRLQAYGRGLNGTATVVYIYSSPSATFSFQLEAESIEVGRGVARLNVSALLQSSRPLRELLPPDALNTLTTLSPQTLSAMLLSSGVNWLFLDELRIELVGDSAMKGYASLLVDYVQLLKSANLSDQLINRILEDSTTISYNYTYESFQASYSNCSVVMAGMGYFTYDNLTEESVKTQQVLMADLLFNALLSDEGREALGFLRELVLMPSNSTLAFRFNISGGSIDASLSAKGIRLVHRDLGGAEGSRRVAQIIISLVESLRRYIPVPANISVTSDVPAITDPAIASSIFRVSELTASGKLLSQTFNAIGAIALPLFTYVGTVTTVTYTYTTVHIPVTFTTTTVPLIPAVSMPQLTVTTTQTVTTTYTQIVPTTLTTTVTRTSVESIAAGAVIAIIGLAVGLLMRKK